MARVLESPLATLLVNPASRAIVGANHAAADLYGYSREQLESLSLEDLDPDLADRPGPVGGPVAARLPRRLHRLADGRELFVDIVAEVVTLDGRALLRATIRPAPSDPHHERVESLRIHQAMAEVNRTALTADHEELVWDEACRIVTETAGYRMASIATPGPDGILEIRVAKGAVGDYLHDRRVDLSDPDSTPTGRAAAERRTVVVQDLTDPSVQSPNKPAALRNGYASTCLIPLLDADEVFGILAVFAGEPFAFDPSHVALLEQLAGDLGLVHALHKQARAQRESEDRYRMLVERAADGITIHDADGCFLDANPAACELLGVTRQELFGRRLEDFAPGLPILWSEATWRTIESGGSASFEQQVLRADGRILTLDVRARLLPDGLVEAVSRDVTAQREMEAQLAQAAKMEAVGQLAGGIAHDFNNILTAIGGYASLVRTGLPPDSPLLDDVGEILAATTRAQSLTSQLLAFGRRSMLEPRLVDVRAVIEGLEPMLRRLIGEDVTLETVLDDHPVTVSVDPGRLEHALVNLAVNARNAMPDGGRLRIGVRLACHGVPDGPPDGDWAVISVVDSGVGMSPDVASRIFEPFYTTRGEGQGTGLGLAMVEGFMRQSGGEVRVASSLGRGTTFWLWLPAAAGQQPSVTAESKPSPSEAPAASARTVLVVEDEPVLRRLAERALERAGHRVLIAADGEEALRAADAHPEPIDLLFSDVVMPGMRGPALATQLRRQRPELRILLTSGYTEEVLERSDGEAHPFLAKPYTPDQLRIKVAEVLDRD
jgi:PAS domain S-box-containing protein